MMNLKPMHRLQEQRVGYALAFLVLLLALCSEKLDWLQEVGWYSLDLSTQWHANQVGQPHPDIVLIDIDDESLTQLAPYVGSWPWPRSVYAYLLDGLQDFQVRSWVFDVLLTEEDKHRPDDDAYWIEAINRHHNLFLSAVVLPEGDGQSMSGKNLPAGLALQQGDPEHVISALWPLGFRSLPQQVGLINATPDEDGVFRRYPLQLTVPAIDELDLSSEESDWRDWRFASMPWRVAGAGQGAALPPNHELWLTFQSTLTIPYQRIRFVDAFQMALQPKQEYADLFQNKILIIGSSAVGLADLKQTAIAPQQPGMVLLATAIDNLLQNNTLHRQSDRWLLLILCWQLAGLLLIFRRHTGFSGFCLWSGIWTVLNALWLLVAIAAFMRMGWLFASGPFFLWLLLSFAGFNTLAALREYRQRQHTAQLFGRFLDPRVVATLVGSNAVGRAEMCRITVLFADIRGFTSLSEQLDAPEVMSLLNRYFSLQVNTLFAHHATLDKFIGDAIMAFWGAPLAQPDQADLALRAATAMIENLQQFQQSLPSRLQSFDIGIGIHTGDAVVGMLGTERRLEYTAIGDTVNIASRLESLSKTHGRVLCSEQTRELLQDDYPLRLVGTCQLKGRQSVTKIYRLGDDVCNDS